METVFQEAGKGSQVQNVIISQGLQWIVCRCDDSDRFHKPTMKLPQQSNTVRLLPKTRAKRRWDKQVLVTDSAPAPSGQDPSKKCSYRVSGSTNTASPSSFPWHRSAHWRAAGQFPVLPTHQKKGKKEKEETKVINLFEFHLPWLFQLQSIRVSKNAAVRLPLLPTHKNKGKKKRQNESNQSNLAPTCPGSFNSRVSGSTNTASPSSSPWQPQCPLACSSPFPSAAGTTLIPQERSPTVCSARP